jgi:DNA-binding transcriptional LysR family regulator
MLDPRRLRVLKEVAAQGSFSGAAEALSYTQSAVSQQIAALEREAGVTLVQRNPRGIRLTEAGDVLVRHADAILTRITDAETELEAIAGLRGGRLRLASFSTAGATLIPQAVAAFHERHPGVDLSLTEADPEDALPMLKAGQIDLAVIFEPNGISELPDSGVERTHLLDDLMRVALPSDHPLTRKARLSLGDLAGEAFVQSTAACPCSVMVSRACAAAGFEPRIAFETDDYLMIQGLVASGVGVALNPDLALATTRADIVIRDLGRGAPVRIVHAATLPGAHRSPATAAMLDVLTEVSANHRAGEARLAVAS